METRKRPSIKLTGGPHGIPRAVVHEVQRGRLLDALAEVIAEEGYLDTTVHKILKRAGISRRTFYEIFTDKEDCFLAAYQEAADHVLVLAQRACRLGGTPEIRIENSLRAMLEFAEREPQLARMCIVEVMAAGEKARQRRAKTMERLTELVAAALEERCETRAEALLRARLLTGGVHEMVYDALARDELEGISELAEEVVASHIAPPEAVHGG
ncbi:MAG TPA: TetR/AcrR family transcriptional regulator [Solirubrobacteraceae bacterium]|nr:TetR/AcrR family transcriptional regulator [Solirubrobacteraceae bacterium]